MKRIKILAYALIAVTMGTTATLNVNKVMKANKTVDYSTTTLTAMGQSTTIIGGENTSIQDCDIFTYNRGYMESWATIEVTASAKAAGFVEYMREIFTIGAEARVGGYIRVPYCEVSSINCCIKTHVDKDVRYL